MIWYTDYHYVCICKEGNNTPQWVLYSDIYRKTFKNSSEMIRQCLKTNSLPVLFLFSMVVITYFLKIDPLRFI